MTQHKINLLLVLLSLLWSAGCGTFDSHNAASRPWNRPNKAEVSQDWLFRDGWESPMDYP
jgi:hypothetical protein